AHHRHLHQAHPRQGARGRRGVRPDRDRHRRRLPLAQMRSARVAIITTAVLLVCLPFALLLVAWLYEQAIVSSYESDLRRVAAVAAAVPFSEWPELGRK